MDRFFFFLSVNLIIASLMSYSAFLAIFNAFYMYIVISLALFIWRRS
jgi:hypothetical protein